MGTNDHAVIGCDAAPRPIIWLWEGSARMERVRARRQHIHTGCDVARPPPAEHPAEEVQTVVVRNARSITDVIGHICTDESSFISDDTHTCGHT